MAIEFNEGNDTFSTTGFQQSINDPFFVRLLKSWGIAQTTQQANLILIGIALVAFTLSAIIFWRSVRGPAPAEIPPEEFEMMQQEAGASAVPQP